MSLSPRLSDLIYQASEEQSTYITFNLALKTFPQPLSKRKKGLKPRRFRAD